MKDEITNNETTPKIWRSIEELQDPAMFKEFAAAEFASNPLSSEEGKDGFARREFLKLMGASLMLSSAACVRRPAQKIIPYAKAPEDVIPGVANYYASSIVESGQVFGTVTISREGRPIKIEGNADHPLNKGAISSRAQAMILSLYDPDRLKEPKKRADGTNFHKRNWLNVSWDKLDEEVVPQLKEGGIALVTRSLPSPSMKNLIEDFFKGFQGKHYSWDPVGADDIAEGQKLAYGKSVVPHYRFEKAKMMVSIGGDFLGTLISPVEFTKRFAKNRKPGADMSKLVVFEGSMTLTGANADARVRVKPSQYVDVAMGLAHEIVVKMGKSSFASDSTVKAALAPFANVASEIGMETALFSEIAKDLVDNKGKSIVIAGGTQARTVAALELQVAVNFLNSVLENDGSTIDAATPMKSFEGSYSAMTDLIADMNAGKVKTLILHRLNPVYSLPKSFGFEEAVKKVKTVIVFTDRDDETAGIATFVAADHHDLETWGDSESYAGVYTVQQPAIRAMYQTRSLASSLMNWASTANVGPKRILEPSGFYEYVKNNWRDNLAKGHFKGDFEDFWVSTLHTGVLDTTAANREKNSAARGFNKASLATVKKSSSKSAFELVLFDSVNMGDGSLANVSWLQELPDPVTKICWENVLMISPKVASQYKLRDGNFVKLSVGNESVEVPVLVQPGQHDQTIALALGYGRTHAGQVANGVGANTFAMTQFEKGKWVTSGIDANFVKIGKFQKLANTQGHNYMEGRQIVVDTTLASYMKNKGSGIHRHKMHTIWPEHQYKGHKWAMSIDLNACTGCSSCMIACQSENNIPVVGKKYVVLGREMHWIRLDRYYSGDAENPLVYFQPVNCQHCDNAPCETVCPVAATVHSDEGLNEMVYNRCVGTRYCSNNCPYKTRRFNWFEYSEVATPLNKQFNPDVGVRMRGVMEKCTLCVQRIKAGKNEALAKNKKLKDGDIVVACESACPADAIVFGDMNDKESRVSKLFQEQRTYELLEEVNARPAVRYMSKVRNSNIAGTSEHGADHGGDEHKKQQGQHKEGGHA